ncbi:MAG: ATP-binding protein [Desulfuromonadales bacterium]
MNESMTGAIVRQTEQIAALKVENETLSRQAERLIESEGKLCELKEEFDAQLNEYAALFAAQKEENEALSRQVKQLIKAEGRLYEFQERLDAQLKEYSELYGLNKTLNAISEYTGLYDLNKTLDAISDLPRIFAHAVAYATNNLGFERILFFQQTGSSGDYSVCASGGYYEKQEKESVMALSIPKESALLVALSYGEGYLVCTETNSRAVLSEYKPRLQMDEYLIYPLGSRVQPMCLLVVGNSEKNAHFYRRISESEATLLSIGNFAELLSSSLENKLNYARLKNALERESLAKIKYRSIFENSVEGIFQTSPDGSFLDCNLATAVILGYDSPEEIICGISDITHQLYVHPQRRTELFAMLLNRQDVKNFEVEFYRKDRSILWALLSVRPKFNEDGELVAIDGVLRDITEQRKLEEQLRQSQKMEVVGTLSGGLAHDFNNVLSGILGSASLLRMQIDRGKEFSREQLCTKLDVVIELCNRAADVVAQLMAISRKQEASLAPVDLRNVIKNIFYICRNTFDKSIDIAVNVPDEQIMINADSIQIEQALLNLCVNAGHAMTIMRKEGDTHGGELLISMERRFMDRHFHIYHPATAEDTEYWIVSVRDTGIGMDAKTVARIFDPFFTTKEKGRGTGLGLAMVYNIVQQHKGLIDVYSEPGIGTTFNVYLPALNSSATPSGDKDSDVIPMGEGLLLVVDDEPFIRQAAQSILEECGYKVLLAENGEVAVSRFREHSDEIRAVVMDMIMPKKSGLDAYIEIRQIRPDVRILFASGFMQDERIAALGEMGIREIINKPYSMRTLAEAVARILA